MSSKESWFRSIFLDKKPGVIIALLAGFLGCGLILYTTNFGPVIFSDSVGYLASARNIMAGNGIGMYHASGQFSVTILQPPFFPLLLAFFGLSGIDLVSMTRILHAVFFGLTLFLSWVGLLRLTGSSVFALAGTLVVLVSPLMVKLFSMAMTEPTFILLSLCALLCLLHALNHDHLGWLATSAVCVGVATITRYVGAAWIASGALMVLIFWPGSWKRRIGALLCYGSIAVFPLASWVGWVKFAVGTLPRGIRPSIDLAQRLIEIRLAFVNTFWSWIPFSDIVSLHYRVKLVGLPILAGLLISLLIFSIRQAMRKDRDSVLHTWLQDPLVRTCSLLWLSLLTYLGIIVFGYIFSDPVPDLNDRILSMGALIVLGITLGTCTAIYRAWPTHFWRYILPLACTGVMIASALPQSIQIVNDYHDQGFGYLSLRWRNSPTLQAAMALPADMPLISNEFSALEFWCGRPVYSIREVTLLEVQPLNARFGDNMEDEAQRAFRQDGAALIIFNNLRWQLDTLYSEQTPDRIDAMTSNLRVHDEYIDGAIYFYPADQP